MYKYQLKKIGGPVTNEIKSALDIENPWADKFAKFDIYQGMYNSRDAILDKDGIEIEPARVKNYEVVKEDLTAELALEDQKKTKKSDAKNALANAKAILVEAKAADTDPKRSQVIVKLARQQLQLLKVLDLFDALEDDA